MELYIKDSLKIVEIWLTNTEKANVSLRESFKPLFKEYQQKKYKVVVFQSGQGDLLYDTAVLLLHNKK